MDDAARRSELDRRNAARHGPRYRSLVLHWLARLPRTPAATEPAAMARVRPGQIGVRFGGHASVLVRTPDLAIAFDPMRGGWIGPVRRERAAGLPDDDLAAVDLVLIGRRGRGHLHPPTLAALPRSATVVVPPGAGRLVSPLGFARLIELAPGQALVHAGVEVHAVAARRDGEPDVALAFVVEGDGPSVFHCGEAGYGPAFAEAGRRFHPDVAFLPIGGYAPQSFRGRAMTPLDALAAFEDLRARLLVPIRHGAFALSYERLDEPARWIAEVAAQRGLTGHVLPLAPGEARVFALPAAGAVATPSAGAPGSGSGSGSGSGAGAGTGSDAGPEPGASAGDDERRGAAPTRLATAPIAG